MNMNKYDLSKQRVTEIVMETLPGTYGNFYQYAVVEREVLGYDKRGGLVCSTPLLTFIKTRREA